MVEHVCLFSSRTVLHYGVNDKQIAPNNRQRENAFWIYDDICIVHAYEYIHIVMGMSQLPKGGLQAFSSGAKLFIT